jgi:uncharacterized membrane protein YfcA
MTFCV